MGITDIWILRIIEQYGYLNNRDITDIWMTLIIGQHCYLNTKYDKELDFEWNKIAQLIVLSN